MPLLDSHRFKRGDLEAWNILATCDMQLAETAKHRRMVDIAEERIIHWARGKRGYISVSWGKDSVCVAHLCALLLPEWPLVSFVNVPVTNPDAYAVRDAFLAMFPHMTYEEFSYSCYRDKAGEWVIRGIKTGTPKARRKYGPAIIKGCRADESAQRQKVQRGGQDWTERNLWPISDWTGDDVYAYLASNDLPIAATYAMSFAGALPRDRIRLASLGASGGRGVGRKEWEESYFSDILYQEIYC